MCVPYWGLLHRLLVAVADGNLFFPSLENFLCKLRSSQSLLFSLEACLKGRWEYDVQRLTCSSVQQGPASSSHLSGQEKGPPSVQTVGGTQKARNLESVPLASR